MIFQPDAIYSEEVIRAVCIAASIIVPLEGAPLLYAQLDGATYRFEAEGDQWRFCIAWRNAPERRVS